jgi:hypothetical protein
VLAFCGAEAVKLELRAMTRRPDNFDRVVMMSSARPSAKNSCSGSPLRFANGTAILHIDGAAKCIDDASEINERAIPGPLDDAATMQSDGRIDQVTAECT